MRRGGGFVERGEEEEVVMVAEAVGGTK